MIACAAGVWVAGRCFVAGNCPGDYPRCAAWCCLYGGSLPVSDRLIVVVGDTHYEVRLQAQLFGMCGVRHRIVAECLGYMVRFVGRNVLTDFSVFAEPVVDGTTGSYQLGIGKVEVFADFPAFP